MFAIKQSIHEGVQCDECQQFPITGTRFKCANCVDYDLCGECEGKTQHTPSHIFVQLRKPVTDVYADPDVPLIRASLYLDDTEVVVKPSPPSPRDLIPINDEDDVAALLGKKELSCKVIKEKPEPVEIKEELACKRILRLPEPSKDLDILTPLVMPCTSRARPNNIPEPTPPILPISSLADRPLACSRLPPSDDILNDLILTAPVSDPAPTPMLKPLASPRKIKEESQLVPPPKPTALELLRQRTACSSPNPRYMKLKVMQQNACARPCPQPKVLTQPNAKNIDIPIVPRVAKSLSEESDESDESDDAPLLQDDLPHCAGPDDEEA